MMNLGSFGRAFSDVSQLSVCLANRSLNSHPYKIALQGYFVINR